MSPRGVPLCVGGCGGAFVLAETAKQVCTTLRLTRLISACKAWAVHTVFLIMAPNVSSVSPPGSDEAADMHPALSRLTSESLAISR
jgi:hypothetical protein